MGALNILECLFIIAIVTVSSKPIDVGNIIKNEELVIPSLETIQVVNATRNSTKSLTRQIGADINYFEYVIEIEPNVGDGRFKGVLAVRVQLQSQDARGEPIPFYVAGLGITKVQYNVGDAAALWDVDDFPVNDDDILEITPAIPSNTYRIFIEYEGDLLPSGNGLYAGRYGDETYVGMNLHPVFARRVFPCMDEPTEASLYKFSFKNMGYNHIVSNSALEDDSEDTFKALTLPPHLWGMVAHNLVNLNSPITHVSFFARSGLVQQDGQASVAINVYYTALNQWTDRTYTELINDQNGNMNILALPDVSRDWNSLSTVGIWEPYIMMQNEHSAKQRSIALTKIAEGMARQWFGGMIYPRNWAFEWVTSGLTTYAAYEVFKGFQSDGTSEDVTLLDAHTLFVTEVIQEGLLLDAYSSARVVEPGLIFNEDAIRDHIHGLLKFKGPALLRMLRLMLGDAETDFIQQGASARLKTGSFLAVDSDDLIDSINSYWLAAGNDDHEYIRNNLDPWILNTGYPILNVGQRTRGVFVSQERFGFATRPPITYDIPLTFTSNANPNFVDTLYPIGTLGGTDTIDIDVTEDDWVLFNIQGQGFYRVNYDNRLWELITEALEDPEQREVIHPLNRATLIDDALNLARGTRLNYDVAFPVVLTMENEKDYAPWRAFVRNMEFLRKRLVAMVTEDEDLDPDIYLRMVRRTIGTVESELTFTPTMSQSEPVMDTLTRGLVMKHACKANYQPCIAAAVDMFYDADDNVNPNIPHDIRPAVYCTMVKEGGGEVIEALMERLEIEASQYERVVILESLACSQDRDYVNSLLQETISDDSPYVAEERVKIFNAVAESSYENARIALDFLQLRTNEVRHMYGGPEKLEEVIFVLAENMANNDLSADFRIWVNSQNNNLEGSEDAAKRALEQVTTNLAWDARYLQEVYDWIDENDAPTFLLSFTALLLSLMVTFFNH